MQARPRPPLGYRVTWLGAAALLLLGALLLPVAFALALELGLRWGRPSDLQGSDPGLQNWAQQGLASLVLVCAATWASRRLALRGVRRRRRLARPWLRTFFGYRIAEGVRLGRDAYATAASASLVGLTAGVALALRGPVLWGALVAAVAAVLAAYDLALCLLVLAQPAGTQVEEQPDGLRFHHPLLPARSGLALPAVVPASGVGVAILLALHPGPAPVPAALGQAGSLAFRVVREGQPVPGARVRLEPGGRWPGAPPASAPHCPCSGASPNLTALAGICDCPANRAFLMALPVGEAPAALERSTDARGQVRFDGLSRQGPYLAYAEGSGLVSGKAEWLVPGAGEVGAVPLELRPLGARHFALHDEAGGPVVGAEVAAFLARPFRRLPARVFGGGIDVEGVPEHEMVTLLVSAPGFAPLVTQSYRSALELYRPRCLLGVVEQDGKPAPGAAVRFDLHEATTGPDGRFAFTDLPALERRRLEARWSGQLAAATVDLSDCAKPPPEPLHLALQRPGELRVQVSGSGSAWISGPGGQQPLKPDADGVALLTDLEPGRYHLSAGWESFGDPVSVLLTPGGRASAAVKVTPRPVVRTRVADSRGGPLAGAEVELLPMAGNDSSTWWARADASGEVELPSVASGLFLLKVIARDHTMVIRLVDLSEGLSDSVLKPMALIEGRLVGPEGKPVEAQVRITDTSTGWRGGAVEPDGRYRLALDQSSPGEVEIEACSKAQRCARARVRAVPGETARLDLVLPP